MFMVAFGSIGAFYGAKTGSNGLSEAWFMPLYVGIVAAVPIAFAINVTRNWR
jgi:hypothetical protein